MNDLNNTKQHLRALVTLRVIARLSSELSSPPKQRELIGEEGALQKEWECLGVIDEYPFGYKTPGQLQDAIALLRSIGLLMVPEPNEGVRAWGHYELTPAGITCAEELDSEDWKTWPTWKAVVTWTKLMGIAKEAVE